MKKIAILIPCHNEEKGLSKVLQDIPREELFQRGYLVEVIVIDNNSTDRTAHVGRQNNAVVISETRKGKGNAVKCGFSFLGSDVDYVVMLDGDNTYKPKEIPRLIEPLESGFCDVIVGSRLGGKVNPGAFKLTNRVVNWGYAFMVRQFYGANVTDVLSGFFAWRREVIDKLGVHLVSNGFTLEMEMITKVVKMGYEIYSVPITYDEREGESKIESVKDGLQILGMFFKNLFWTIDKKNMISNVSNTESNRSVDTVHLQ